MAVKLTAQNAAARPAQTSESARRRQYRMANRSARRKFFMTLRSVCIRAQPRRKGLPVVTQAAARDKIERLSEKGTGPLHSRRKSLFLGQDPRVLSPFRT